MLLPKNFWRILPYWKVDMKYDIVCEECGKFCRPSDKGTYYGSCNDLEPPDVSYFCKKCVDKKLKQPHKIIIGCWWVKPNYVRVAKSIQRHEKKLTSHIKIN